MKKTAAKNKGTVPFIHQKQIISAPDAFKNVSYFFLCGGYGCGKSFSIVLMIFIICKKYQGEDVTVGLCSTTITLLQKTVILDLQKICKKTGSRFEYNQKDNIITIGTIRFLLIATGQPNDIYGPNVNICLCDEVDELPEQKAIEAHKALSERTRITLPDGRKPYIMYFSTTHGYRGLYKIVQKLKADRLPYVLVRGLTKNNTSLDPQYVKNLYAIYDEQERLAYLEGMFVNLQSGRVYASYDEATCKCKPFEITADMTVMTGQDLNSGFSKAVAVVKKDKVLYIVRGWSFKEVGGAPAIMRSTYQQNEILWFPDCSGKEILKGYKQEILDNGIQCRIGTANPRILDRVFYVNKLFKMGLLKVFDCPETNDLSESLKVRAYNDLGQPEKGKGENAPDHYCITGDSLIYTTKGKFKIKDLVGKKFNVLSYNLERKAVEIGRCVECQKTGIDREVMELELEDGQKLRLTPGHKVLTNEGYKECKGLTENDKILVIDTLSYAETTIKQRGVKCITQKVKSILLWIVSGFAEMTKQAIIFAQEKVEKPLQIINTLSSNIAVRLAAGKCGVKEIRVKSVKRLSEREDVYNMTVLHNHNYAVQSGIISKNCDSLEYVIYRIVRSDPDFMDLKELSRENVKENGYLNIAGNNV